MTASDSPSANIKQTLLNIKQKYQQVSNQQLARVAAQVSVVNRSAEPPSNKAVVEAYTGRFSVGEELLFSLNIGSAFLGDAFTVKSETGYRIGLAEFSQLVDFAIEVDPESGTADGWFNHPDNEFSLLFKDDGTLVANVRDQQYLLTPEQYNVDGDIFVELETLATWFDFTPQVNDAQLAIDMQTEQPFPIEQRLARSRRQGNVGFTTTQSVLPLQQSDYQIFSNPLLDAQFSVSQSPSKTNAAYSLLSSQDMAYFSSQIFLAGTDDDALNNARITLSKQSDSRDLLGPLKMTEYAFGDVVPVSIGASATQAMGRGIRMHNAKSRLVDNRTVNLVGEVQTGWDVELYRNGILLDSLSAVSDGRYEFNDIDLGFGSNDFELVFYGPQGQIERREESYYIDSNNVTKGESVIQFSAVDANRSVLGVGDDTGDASMLGFAIGTEIDYGLTDWLSVGVGASIFRPDEGETEEDIGFTSGVNLGALGLLNSSFQVSQDDRKSMKHSFRTRLFDTSFNLSYTKDEIPSEIVEQQEAFTRNTSQNINLRFSGQLFGTTLLPLSYENSLTHAKQLDGSTFELVQNSVGTNTPWGSVSHGLLWQRRVSPEQTEPNDNDAQLFGNLAYRTKIGRMFTRVYADYDIQPSVSLNSIGTTLNYAFSNTLNSEFRYVYDVNTDKDRLDLRLNWQGDDLAVSGSANYSASDNWSINLTVRLGLGFNYDTGQFITSGRQMAMAGSTAVRVFEDTNFDNQYNHNEPVLENVLVKASQAYRKDTTDETGLAVLKALPEGIKTDIVVDESTLPEYGMMVAGEGFAIASRRGLLQHYDIPVVRGGELEGTIYWRTGSEVEEIAPYVKLHLINDKGEIVATTRSEFDGYYLFDRVMPGNYSIEVDTSSGRHRGMTPERNKRVKVSDRGDLLTGIDFTLRPLHSAKGYTATIDNFTSLNLLHIYFNLIKERLPASFTQDAFYFNKADDDTYMLGLLYVEGENEEAQQQVEEFCGQLNTHDIKCRAELLIIEY